MKLLLILLLSVSVYGDIKKRMYNLYQNKKYEDVCNVGFNNYYRYKQDESYISLYAFACLKADFIDRLSMPIAVLKFSREARSNSAYFSVILMQKKLLYHALVDNYDVSEMNLPTTDYVLSKVFDLYAKLEDKSPRSFYLFEDKDDNKLSYKLYLVKDDRLSKIIIEEYYDSISIKRHVYW